MGLLLLLFVILLLAAVGVLGFVLKVAAGIALGLFLAVVLVSALITWRVRRFLYGSRPRWRRVRGSSRVEVLDPRNRSSLN
jgi:membrane protein implicated in regulation of membrane protease activity